MGKFRMSLTILRIFQCLMTSPSTARYGLEIGKEADLSNGALYPALERLTSAGFLESELEDIDEVKEGRRKRRYYRLTPDGLTFAREQLADAPTLPAQAAFGGAL